MNIFNYADYDNEKINLCFIHVHYDINQRNISETMARSSLCLAYIIEFDKVVLINYSKLFDALPEYRMI